ncbi:MAG: hypothetical protein RLZZ436_305 [Planctomycetota bacterium]
MSAVRNCLLCCMCLATIPGTVGAGWEADDSGQPLASNTSRLLQTLEFLGQPLSSVDREKLDAAILAEDAQTIQRLLDPQVLAVVTINPESRVKVERGTGAPAVMLQQAGFTAALVKIINHGSVKTALAVTSPQAGPAYSGSTRLAVERLDQPLLHQPDKPAPGPRRFAILEWYSQPPMTGTLSGLPVEYGLLLIGTSDAGKQEIVLQFSVGEQTQDLGFRGELPLVFDSHPAVPVRIEVQDAEDSEAFVRLTFRDAQDRVCPPQIRRLAPDLFFQEQIYRKHGEVVWLAPGKYALEYSRGPEFLRSRMQLDVRPPDQVQQGAAANGPTHSPPQVLRVRPERWVHPADFGWYSGDHHIHGAGCAHYQNPTEGVTPADMFRQISGEGLNVGCILTWGPCFEYQRQFFRPEVDLLSRGRTLMKYDLEVSGFGSQALGHVCLLNLSDQVYPGSDGTKEQGWPTWTTPVLRWAKAQGAVTGFAHSASGLQVDPQKAAERLALTCDADGNGLLSPAECDAGAALLPAPFHRIDADSDGSLSRRELQSALDRAADELPNLAIPEMNSVGAMELPVAVFAGVCDFISAMDTPRIAEWNMWYHILNCGYPLKVAGETDFPCMSGMAVGQGRSYVQLGRQPLDFSRWCHALAAGRSYVSDGYAHALSLDVTAGDKDGTIGDVIELSRPATVRVRAQIAFAPEIPESIAYANRGTSDSPRWLGDTVTLHGERSRRWVQGGERRVELVMNGQPVDFRVVPADGQIHAVEFQVPVEFSSWLAIRHFPQLHSNPVEVRVSGQPIRASATSARWCAATIRRLWEVRSGSIAPAERETAQDMFQQAIAEYEMRAKNSAGL